MRSMLLSALILLASLVIGRAVLGVAPETDPLAGARAALARADADAAIALLDPLAVEGSPTRLEALALRATAREAKGDAGAALADLDAAIAGGVAGPARIGVDFARARVLAALGRKVEALAATRAAVDALRELGRRGALAKPWIDAARELLEPPAGATAAQRAAFKPDFGTAKELLSSALETGALGPDLLRVELDVLRCEEALGGVPVDLHARKILAAHPDAAPELRGEALMRLGNALLAQGDGPGALAAARAIDALGSAGESAKKLWLAIATDEVGAQYGDEPRDVIARVQEATDRLVALDPGGEAAETARFVLASRLAGIAELVPSAVKTLIAARDARPASARALEIELRIAELLAVSSDGTWAAITRLDRFVAEHPIGDAARTATALVEGLMKRESKRLATAASQASGDERKETLAAAREAWTRFTGRFPGSADLAAALFAIADIDASLEKLDEALAGYADVRARFPAAPEADAALVASAKLLADKKADPAGALAMLDGLRPDSPSRPDADSLRRSIVEPALEMVAAKVFRSDETPEVKLSSRNLEKIEIALYRVNLEEYFLATASLDVLDGIDVSLIAPDKRFEVAGSEPNSHSPKEQKVALEALKPGEAMIVAARGGSLEARTLVLCSDLDVAVLRTGESLRAFGVDRRSGQVVTTLALRIAKQTSGEDRPRLLPAETDLQKLGGPEALAIVAVAQNGLAGTMPAPKPGMVPATPHGFVALDRVVARPGEMLRVFGAARDEQGKPIATGLELLVVDPAQGQPLRRIPLSAGADGGFHAAIRLDPALPDPRTIEVRLVRLVPEAGSAPEARAPLAPNAKDEFLASATCAVAAYRDADVRVEFEPTAADVARGEATIVFARLIDSRGRPRAGQAATLRVNEGAEVVRTSDALGRIAIEIGREDTQDRDVLDVAATLGGSGVAFVFREPLLRLRPALAFASGEPPAELVAGDAIEATLKLANDRGTPVVGKIAWTLSKRKAAADVAVASGELTTAADGTARLAVAVAAPGSHRLRLEWIDEHGLVQRVERQVTAFGDPGSKQIEIVGPARLPAPGEAFPLRVIWPFAAGPALLAVHGAALERAEVVHLEKGVNVVEVKAPAVAVNTFVVAVDALLEDAQAREFLALREARTVAVEVAPRSTDPAAAIESSIRVRDGQTGKPARVFAYVLEEAPGAALASTVSRASWWQKLRMPEPAIVVSSSAARSVPSDTSWIDPTIGRALTDIEHAAASTEAAVMVERLRLDDLVDRRRLPGEPENDPSFGGGGGGPTTGGFQSAQGGGGATSGGRAGKGKNRPTAVREYVEPAVATAIDLATDANGDATFRFAPPRPGRWSIVAIAIGADGGVAVTRTSFVHAPPIEARVDAAAIDGARQLRVRVGRRDRESGAIAIDAHAESSPATPVASLSLEVPPLSTAETLLDLKRDDVGLVIRVGGRLDLPLPERARSRSVAPSFAFAADGRLVISAADRAAIAAPGVPPSRFFASPRRALAALETPDDRLDFESAAWRVFAAAQALALEPPGAVPDPTALQLRRGTDEAVAHLLAFVPAGGMSAPGTRSQSWLSRELQPLLLLALDAASDAKVALPAGVLSQAADLVDASLVKTSAPRRRALPLFALAAAGRASFEKLNRLQRDADQLAARELALLCLAFHAADRKAEADATAALLATALAAGEPALDTDAPAGEPLGSRSEVAALALSALSAVPDGPAHAIPRAALARTALDAAGGGLPILLATVSVAPATRITFAAGGVEKAIELAADEGGTTVDLAALGLPEGDVTISSGASPLLATIPFAPVAAAVKEGVTITRRFSRISAMRDGKLVPVGASVVTDGLRTQTDTRRLGIDRAYDVRVSVRLTDTAPRGVWVFEPAIPGITIDENSIYGPEELVATDAGWWILLHPPEGGSAGRLFGYRAFAAAPGAFSAPPSILRASRFSPGASLADSGGPYSVETGDVDSDVAPTPDERLAAGLAAESEGRHADAIEWLMPLVDPASPTLVGSNEAFALRALLRSAIALGRDAEIVRVFEISKERDPEYVLSFDSMDRVAKAYAAIGAGEVERSRQVLSAIADALFLQEARVVGRLERLGDHRTAVAILERLLAEHDATPTVLETAFAFGQHAYDLARAAPESISPPASPADSKARLLDRGEWLAVGRRALEARLAAAAGGSKAADADAEDVALTLANLLLEAGALDDAVALTVSAKSRFAKGRFLGTWDYVLAFAAFAKRDLDGVLRHAETLVATAERASDEPTRRLAIVGRHMLAQAWHAKGDLAKARELYAKVKDDVEDAKLALDALERSALRAPKLVFAGSAVGPDGKSTLEIDIERAGSTGPVDVSFYPIDLRLLYLKHRGFDALAEVELAGIAPAKRIKVEPVPDPARRGSEKVVLDAPGIGAYLLAIRAGDLHARSLAVVSDLSIEVLPQAGGARVTATARASGAPLPDTLVTFVGSESGEFVTRKADLRGVAAATGLQGRLAVIAQREGHYAFFQGEDDLPVPEADKANVELRQDAGQQQELQSQTDEQLKDVRERYAGVWESNTNRAQTGVEVKRTKQ